MTPQPSVNKNVPPASEWNHASQAPVQLSTVMSDSFERPEAETAEEIHEGYIWALPLHFITLTQWLIFPINHATFNIYNNLIELIMTLTPPPQSRPAQVFIFIFIFWNLKATSLNFWSIQTDSFFGLGWVVVWITFRWNKVCICEKLAAYLIRSWDWRGIQEFWWNHAWWSSDSKSQG